MKILEINNLSVKFSQEGTNFEAVKGISFFLNAGEILGLIGESGSGKSVASQSITRLISRKRSIYNFFLKLTITSGSFFGSIHFQSINSGYLVFIFISLFIS